MIQSIIIWTLLILAIALPLIIIEINFRKKVKELNKKFYREGKKIDELEKRLSNKTIKECNHGFSVREVSDTTIEPTCKNGCGKTLSELTKK